MRRLFVSAAIVGALALAGCGNNGDTEEPPPTPGPHDTAPTPPASPPAEQGTPGQAAPERPAPGSCVDLPEADDGRYQVADAGTAVVRRDGGRLVIEEVEPASGWSTEVTENVIDEVEIVFRGDGVELELEVEIDDGRTEVTVCHDD